MMKVSAGQVRCPSFFSLSSQLWAPDYVAFNGQTLAGKPSKHCQDFPLETPYRFSDLSLIMLALGASSINPPTSSIASTTSSRSTACS
jgi:hypothetical protein